MDGTTFGKTPGSSSTGARGLHKVFGLMVQVRCSEQDKQDQRS